MSLKAKIWEILEVHHTDCRLNQYLNIFMTTLIFLNVVAIILETVEPLQRSFGQLFYGFAVFSVVIFTLEYLARIWACVVEPAYQSPVIGRLKFMFRPMLLIDLIAIIPFYLSAFSMDTRFLRIFRLFRLLTVIRIGRYYSKLTVIKNVVHSKKEELLLTIIFMGLVLVIASCAVYYIEHPVQPEAFPDIPSTLWWGVVTLTTIGYGDVFPVTVLGKIVTSFIAILGIGIFALPAAVLSAGFIEEMHKDKERGKPPERKKCPHCGQWLD